MGGYEREIDGGVLTAEQIREMATTRVFKIVLTGGPCAGKTTALAALTERFCATHLVYCVPESATTLIHGGANPADSGIDFQYAVLQLQEANEAAFCRLAQRDADRCKKPAIVFCDRGTMDGKAYTSSDLWRATLSMASCSEERLKTDYDAVIHMVSAAIGAAESYTTANNTARKETPELAARLDRLTCEAWVGHPHMRVIDNSTGFDGKIKKTIAAVCRVVGHPEPLETERRYLVDQIEWPNDVRRETTEITQTYLVNPDGNTERVRSRGRDGFYRYTHTVKRQVRPGVRVEEERQIDGREYVMLMRRKMPGTEAIHKERTCFVWNGRYYELDTFPFMLGDKAIRRILEIETDEENELVQVPPFISVVEDITDRRDMSNFALAQRRFRAGMDGVE